MIGKLLRLLSSSSFKEDLWSLTFVRYLFWFASLGASAFIYALLNPLLGAKLYMRSYRLILEYKSTNTLSSLLLPAYHRIFKIILGHSQHSGNKILCSFYESSAHSDIISYFRELPLEYRVSLKYPRQNDFPERQGDLMVLKPANQITGEKGVLLIKFTESIAKFAALYDLRRVADQYMLLLEPSSWGYQNVNFLYLNHLPTPMFIECPYEKDFRFIQRSFPNFIPVRLGSGDWIDSNLFRDGHKNKKIFDLIMVGSWSTVKRHDVLLKAVRQLPSNFHCRIALVGYPIHGRTIKDIRADVARYGLESQTDIYDSIPNEQVADLLRQSKVYVLLSKSEGANRAVYEALLSGNLIVVSDENKGVNRDIINPHTGFLSNDENLPDVLLKAIDQYPQYHTAKWANHNTGYVLSTHKLNAIIKKVVTARGEPWTKDLYQRINRPNLLYANDHDRIESLSAYNGLRKLLIN